ncbi:MAG: hypothetical protein FIB04_13315, partial [Gammaproteobacteria bacterium]|nr:hypothetical protein [Gammaproteobacteria bacterium]
MEVARLERALHVRLRLCRKLDPAGSLDRAGKKGRSGYAAASRTSTSEHGVLGGAARYPQAARRYTLPPPSRVCPRFLPSLSRPPVVETSLWNQCLRRLEEELPAQHFNTWIRPLQAVEASGRLRLLAPNRYVVEWVNQNCAGRINELLDELVPPPAPDLVVEVGSRRAEEAPATPARPAESRPKREEVLPQIGGRLNPDFTFGNFVEGKSNQLARAAAMQVAENPGRAYNPLFIYGGVGLGKTHLMHAIGNHIRSRNKDARISYVHSERFVGDMVRALQHNTINEFKTAYRSLDALLIDDIQFFAGKERSQEEF